MLFGKSCLWTGDGKGKKEKGQECRRASIYLLDKAGARNATGTSRNEWMGRAMSVPGLAAGRQGGLFRGRHDPGTHRRALLDWQTDKHLFQETPASFPSSFTSKPVELFLFTASPG
jgi:hypothetical protein